MAHTAMNIEVSEEAFRCPACAVIVPGDETSLAEHLLRQCPQSSDRQREVSEAFLALMERHRS
jgi:Zn finger protein HypA/HybF involved in hydrogenase expression